MNELMASELDNEPNIIKGATLPELFAIAKLVAVGALFLGVIISLLIAPKYIVLISLVFLFLGTFLGVWLSAIALKSFKRDKPPGYFMQKVELFMFKVFHKSPVFCLKKGKWL